MYKIDCLMKNISIVVLSLIVLVLVSCNKEKKYPSVNLSFQTQLNGSNCSLSQVFPDSQNKSIRLELVKFYLSKISFVNHKDEVVELKDIALIDLNSSGTAMMSFALPNDSYKSLKFGVGVHKEFNSQTPADFTEENHPLNSVQNTYWGMNGMYRFVMIDGRYDIENDNIFDGTFSYHSGFESSYREVELIKDFKFKKNETYDLTIFIDIAKILEGTGGNLDLINRPNYHGNSEDMDLATTLSDNVSQVFSF
jgi:hypothetical protein